MAVLLFVLFWVALALALVIVALGAGRRRRGDAGSARGGYTGWLIGFALTLAVFGAGLPIAASFGSRDGAEKIASADVSNLSSDAQHGRELFAQHCKLCHTLKATNAIAEVGPNLDTLRPPKALVLDAIKNGRARGNGAMAANLVSGQDAEDVATFVSLAVGQGGK